MTLTLAHKTAGRIKSVSLDIQEPQACLFDDPTSSSWEEIETIARDNHHYVNLIKKDMQEQGYRPL